MQIQEVEKPTIKAYWEERLPQVWYSKHEPYTIQWFNELAYKRYHVYYSYLPMVAEFDAHSGEKVLEIGVGVGSDLVSYARCGALVSGIDLTENALETTKKNLEQNNLSSETLKTADAENLPFEDDYFDLVYSFGVLHHTPRTDKAIKEIHRVLKPHGKAIVMLYARGWKHYVKRVFINGVLRGQLIRESYDQVVNKNTEVHGKSPLTYVYKRTEIEKMFDCFGTTEIERHRLGEYFDYAPYQTKKLPDFICNFISFFEFQKIFGENYIIKARKEEKEVRKVTFVDTFFKA